MFFKQHTFKKVDFSKILKKQMNGLQDETLSEFCPLSVSSFMKKEYAEQYIHDEYIESYLTSAEILAEKEYKRTHSNGTICALVTPKPALSITIYFLCRHTIELTIKKYIHLFYGTPNYEHNLIKIWDYFYNLIPKDISSKDNSTLKNIKHFLEGINNLDNNGTITRYPVDKNEESNMNTFYWFNPLELVIQTRKFIDQMNQISKFNDLKDNKIYR